MSRPDLVTPIANPADFVKPDGSYDVTPMNWPTADEMQAINAQRRKGES